MAAIQGRKGCPVSYTLGDIATMVAGELHGDPSRVIAGVAPINQATGTDLTFLTGLKEFNKVRTFNAAAYLVTAEIRQQWAAPEAPTIAVADPMKSAQAVARQFLPESTALPPGIDPRAAVDGSAVLEPDVHIGPFAVIGPNCRIGARTVIHPHAVVGSDCRVGSDVQIHPHAVLYPRTTLADRSIVHAGAILGADGFGYRFVEGRHERVPQLGSVEIGEDVEIGAGSTIDRATFGATRIGAGTKIDNLVMVGHNCLIGRHNILVSQVGLSGSVHTGDYVILGGQVGVADHVSIGTGAKVMARSGVHTDIPSHETWGFSPAMPEGLARRVIMTLSKIHEMKKQLAEVRRKMGLSDDAETVDRKQPRVA